MGIIDLASNKAIWRGIDYYKQNRVVSCTMNEDGTYEGTVTGSNV